MFSIKTACQHEVPVEFNTRTRTDTTLSTCLEYFSYFYFSLTKANSFSYFLNHDMVTQPYWNPSFPNACITVPYNDKDFIKLTSPLTQYFHYEHFLETQDQCDCVSVELWDITRDRLAILYQSISVQSHFHLHTRGHNCNLIEFHFISFTFSTKTFNSAAFSGLVTGKKEVIYKHYEYIQDSQAADTECCIFSFFSDILLGMSFHTKECHVFVFFVIWNTYLFIFLFL